LGSRALKWIVVECHLPSKHAGEQPFQYNVPVAFALLEFHELHVMSLMYRFESAHVRTMLVGRT
jgi:hypothetical protein